MYASLILLYFYWLVKLKFKFKTNYHRPKLSLIYKIRVRPASEFLSQERGGGRKWRGVEEMTEERGGGWMEKEGGNKGKRGGKADQLAGLKIAS